MKHYYILALLVFSVADTLYAQNESENDGPVMKSVKESMYKPKNGQLKARESLFDDGLNTIIIYDKNGDMTEIRRFEDYGVLIETTYYERNKAGKAIEGMVIDQSEIVKNYWTCQYNSDNKLIEVLSYNSDDRLIQIQNNTYDANGNLIVMSMSDPDRNPQWKHEYKYNAKNQKIEQLRYLRDGSLKDRRTYEYNKDGQEVAQYKFNSKDDGYTKFVSTYDEMGNLIIQNWFDETGKQTHQTTFEYVYDPYGNWISKRRGSDGKLNMVWEREIEYYD
ncbi:hypothetical protein [Gilvibacter sp.]|uniref:hypothetical protein n=1 Tax=Gilvibacter sp. TaxID=2729997 RepID=UPI0025C4930F|nr:hypothetical protein [Gilvibacter sp.]NQX78086.1 hypothetical protein [Gilvibacter sp.]